MKKTFNSIMKKGLKIKDIIKSSNKNILYYNTLTNEYVQSPEGLTVWGYTELEDSIVINLVLR